jgi:hypothetical protein
VGSIAGRLKSKSDVKWLGGTRLPPPDNAKVKTAEYISSAVRPDQMPREGADLMGDFAELTGRAKAGRPEIAFIGRSNVGKSSLINMLTSKKGLALVSKTPGACGASPSQRASTYRCCRIACTSTVHPRDML